jgi:hypothetical protein
MLDANLKAPLLAALIAVSLGAFRLAAADPPAASAPPAPPAAVRTPVAPTCLEAIVSPVSGFAECVNPRGAPVAAPPPRPAADNHSEPTVEPDK